MGTVALDVLDGSSTYLRVHAFCARPSTSLAVEMGDVSLVLINIAANDTYQMDHLDLFPMTVTDRSEFLVQADGHPALSARQVLVNGQRLQVGDPLPLPPRIRHDQRPIVVEPYSILFVILHGVLAPACTREGSESTGQSAMDNSSSWLSLGSGIAAAVFVVVVVVAGALLRWTGGTAARYEATPLAHEEVEDNKYRDEVELPPMS